MVRQSHPLLCLLLQVRKLQAILKPMMLRRLKDDVEKNLAPKEETIIEVGVASDSHLTIPQYSDSAEKACL